MTKQVAISDDLAELLEARRKEDGLPTLDAAAEQAIRQGLANDETPYTVEELRALIAEADASGPAEPWDAKSFREEILSAYDAQKVGARSSR